MGASLSVAVAAGLVSGARSLRGEALRARTASSETRDPKAAAALERAARGMEGYAFLLSTVAELCVGRQ